MRRALALAGRARGRTAPNPMVGCVLVKSGRIVGAGYHHRVGLPHAEVEALKDAGSRARGATAYVTLEPCNHTGRTGPCTEALIAARVASVVIAMRDPNPHVDGGGTRKLRAAGIAVATGLLGDEARAGNAGFIHLVTTGRPRVTLKAAVSLDGRIAASSGDAKWITGEPARREAHTLRDACDAILVGAGTVRADDPALTTRLPGGRGRDPLRVILDGKLTIPRRAQVVREGTLIATTRAAPRAAEARLVARGAEVVRLPGAKGRVDLPSLLDEMGRRGVMELLIEGGAEVHGQFLAARLVDRVMIFVAPILIGAAGVPLFALPGAARIADAWRLRAVSTRRLGDDMLLVGLLDGDASRR
ncbi:MAG: bifunctional diaminohydroxyphosphoribosylaminopyrimidine deaminase/5-amino-6-(5-phosphoribosylamino)uracil reductase RibD [Myxococcales bacterium]|nr:bifunctional diaminohydroxyphosphoribosylaminopyrimidine deaminase/5-amino-6-(5-phosphoribosylamino)uracil reductase RibD [Myxococcales bacterium]